MRQDMPCQGEEVPDPAVTMDYYLDAPVGIVSCELFHIVAASLSGVGLDLGNAPRYIVDTDDIEGTIVAALDHLDLYDDFEDKALVRWRVLAAYRTAYRLLDAARRVDQVFLQSDGDAPRA